MAAEKPEKKEKKDKKRSDESGVSKPKKEKKDKKDKKEKLAAALEEKIQQDAPVAVAAAANMDEDSDAEEDKAAELPLERVVVPFALPVADDKGMKKVYKTIRKAAKNNTLKRGVKEVVKTLRKSAPSGPGNTSFPLNALYEKWVGFLSRIYIPYPLRGIVLGFYSWSHQAKMEEAEDPNYYSYRSVSEWFGRPLKKSLRPISEASLVSPVDGEVLVVSEIEENKKMATVKGYDYNVHEFLGPIDLPEIDPKNRLYQFVINLRPGNYHGIHSPTDFKVDEVVDIPGLEITAHRFFLRWFAPRLLKKDERVVMSGRWKHGYFSMTPVAALGVGDILIYTDPVNEAAEILSTEVCKFDPAIEFKAGQKVGKFRFGSTLALIFEAPPGLDFRFQGKDAIKYGEALLNNDI